MKVPVHSDIDSENIYTTTFATVTNPSKGNRDTTLNITFVGNQFQDTLHRSTPLGAAVKERECHSLTPSFKRYTNRK